MQWEPCCGGGESVGSLWSGFGQQEEHRQKGAIQKKDVNGAQMRRFGLWIAPEEKLALPFFQRLLLTWTERVLTTQPTPLHPKNQQEESGRGERKSVGNWGESSETLHIRLYWSLRSGAGRLRPHNRLLGGASLRASSPLRAGEVGAFKSPHRCKLHPVYEMGEVCLAIQKTCSASSQLEWIRVVCRGFLSRPPPQNTSDLWYMRGFIREASCRRQRRWKRTAARVVIWLRYKVTSKAVCFLGWGVFAPVQRSSGFRGGLNKTGI